MSALAKLMIAATAAIMLVGPAAAWETPKMDVAVVEPGCAGWGVSEACLAKAAQPTKFCFEEGKCTTGAPAMVTELKRFDAMMDAANTD